VLSGGPLPGRPLRMTTQLLYLRFTLKWAER
jgi:hypothetical protein